MTVLGPASLFTQCTTPPHSSRRSASTSPPRSASSSPGPIIFTLVALNYIDIINRSRILIFSVPSMIVGLVLASVAFHFTTHKTGGQLVDGELFALEFRDIGVSLATTTERACNLLTRATYLSLMDCIMRAGACGFYAGLCLLGYAEVQLIFRSGFGIWESERLRAQKRALLSAVNEVKASSEASHSIEEV
ncbi:hypothetical protein BN946_scf184983.g54 [Trametes cinnabarina]|uniref:Uncharacterized protein n=1 Tax=Pycnoporus cinnabarinus TaxID=5643 RepID=A0A060SEB5_PYCCI|nr:hypothetical protein BN946_scf184983.g54 [Trametes cinnabarina]